MRLAYDLGGYTFTWSIYAFLLVGLALFASGWMVKGWQAKKAIAELRAEQAQGTATRAEATRTDETQTAIKESKHAQDAMYNADRLKAPLYRHY